MDENDVSGLVTCPFCGDLVGADAVQCGIERLHPACYKAMNEEQCQHNTMVERNDPEHAWECADCGYVYKQEITNV